MSNLLLDEQPLIILPKLAELIGLNEAIILQQVHYWVSINKKVKNNMRDGEYWTYNTFLEWQEQFPFWSLNTIKRTIASLEKRNLLIVGNFNKMKIDRTKWYRINYKELQALQISPLTQNEPMDDPKWDNGLAQNGSTNTRDYTKTKTDSIGANETSDSLKENKDEVLNLKIKSIEDNKANKDLQLKAKELIDYFNSKDNKRYTTSKEILILLKETLQDDIFKDIENIKAVIDFKYDTRLTENDYKYYRPKTLFRLSNLQEQWNHLQNSSIQKNKDASPKASKVYFWIECGQLQESNIIPMAVPPELIFMSKEDALQSIA